MERVGVTEEAGEVAGVWRRAVRGMLRKNRLEEPPNTDANAGGTTSYIDHVIVDSGATTGEGGYNPADASLPRDRHHHHRRGQGQGRKSGELPSWAYQRHMSYISADLHISEYRGYLVAIQEDDADTVKSVLRGASRNHLTRLLNNKFDFHDKDISKFNKNKHLTVRRPLCVAALSGSVKVIKVFVAHGIDVSATEYKQNVVHVIIRMAYFDLESEVMFKNTYNKLMSYLSHQQRKQLLMCENNSGFRPLELAAHLGTLFLFQEILNTEGVYLAKIVRNGLCVYRWYDISDYEYYGSATSTHAKKGRGTGEQLTLRNRAEPRDGRGVTDQEDDSDVLRNVDVDDSFKVQDRNHFSPLLSLMMLDSKHLLHSNLHQVLFQEPIFTWINSKFSLNLPVVFVWMISRVVLVIVYLLLDLNVTLDVGDDRGVIEGTNITNLEPGYEYCKFVLDGFVIKRSYRSPLNIYLMTHTVLILVMDFIDSFVRWIKKDFFHYVNVFENEKKYPLSHARFYETVQRGFAVCIIVDAIFKYTNITGNLPHMVRMFSMLLAPWTIMFFIQLLPSIGYFVMAIQKMLRQLSNFCVVFAIFILGFTHAFFVSVNSYPRNGCDNTFESLPRALFSTFMMMLNIMNPRSLSLDEPISLYVLHVAYTFIVGILLINFLVAIMTTAMGEITGHQPAILVIQRLSVIYSFERRFRLLCPVYYRFMLKRKFLILDNRTFLVRASPILNSSTSKSRKHH